MLVVVRGDEAAFTSKTVDGVWVERLVRALGVRAEGKGSGPHCPFRNLFPASHRRGAAAKQQRKTEQSWASEGGKSAGAEPAPGPPMEGALLARDTPSVTQSLLPPG